MRYISGSSAWIFIGCVSEAMARRCSVKKAFEEISQNSQKNTSARVSFLKELQADPSNFIKKYSLAQVLSCKLRNFYRTPPVAASVAFIVRPRSWWSSSMNVSNTLIVGCMWVTCGLHVGYTWFNWNFSWYHFVLWWKKVILNKNCYFVLSPTLRKKKSWGTSLPVSFSAW